MKRIFDCFTFFNELDILEFRLKETYELVDYFVICESAVTFQGNAKALNFRANVDRFAPYADKIHYVVVPDMPTGPNPWAREHHQRNHIRTAAAHAGARPDDIVIVSDVDEILNEHALRTLRGGEGFFQLVMTMYQFYMNYLVPNQRWTKPYAASWRLFGQIEDISLVRTKQDEVFAAFRQYAHRIEPAGWHFTFLGGANRVREKLLSYSHTESHVGRLLQAGEAEKSIRAGFDISGAELTKFVTVDDNFPKTLLREMDYYVAKGFVRTAEQRIGDLERAYADLNATVSREARARSDLLGKAAALIRNANEALTQYENPHFKHIRFDGPNLVPASRDFSKGWFAGVQSRRANFSTEIVHYAFGNQVIAHHRDPKLSMADNNVGWFDIRREHFEPGAAYTASCYIWMPLAEDIQNIRLDLSRCELKVRTTVDYARRDCWQRIHSTSLFGPAASASPYPHLSLTLRMDGTSPVIYSTCWQLEIGTVDHMYRATPELPD